MTGIECETAPEALEEFALQVVAALGPGWDFGFDHARRRAGACDFTHRRITVSLYACQVASEPEMQQVVLHEVAHAIAGAESGHDAHWLSIARSLGYSGGVRTSIPMAEEFAPWIGRCPAGHAHYRFQRPRGTMSCGSCARGFDRGAIIRWHQRTTG